MSDLTTLLEQASGECPPCADGPCAIQPCGYHCKYPYTDDSTMWVENCPTCRERREANAALAALAVNQIEALRDAVRAIQLRAEPGRSHAWTLDDACREVGWIDNECRRALAAVEQAAKEATR